MPNEVTKRFIECYKELRNYDKIKSDRQFCLVLDYSPQSWIKILKGERDVTIELIRLSISAFSFNPVYLFSGQGEQFSLNSDSTQLKTEEISKKIFHIPVTAKAGYLDQINEPVYADNLISYSLPIDYFHHGEFRSFEIEGDSMEPVLTQGEIVICTKLDDPALWCSNIKSGYVYVLIMKDDIVVKRVNNHLKSENKLQLCSDNSGYPDIIISLEDVFEVWLVKMKISPFAHSKINLRQELVGKYSELEKTIKMQSEMITGMQCTMEKMLQKNRYI